LIQGSHDYPRDFFNSLRYTVVQPTMATAQAVAATGLL